MFCGPLSFSTKQDFALPHMKRIDVAIEAAKAAGEVICSGDRGNLDVKEKESSRTSIVTAIDLRSQQEIVRSHSARFSE